MKSMTADLGKLVREQFERSVRNSKVTARTQALMATCYDQLEDAIEELCPAAMAIGPKGVGAAYGPQVGEAKRLVVFATTRSYLIVAVDQWPSEIAGAIPEGIKNAEFWAVMAEAIDGQDVDQAMTAFVCRIGIEQTKVLDAELQKASRARFTPIIVVVAATDAAQNVACGGSQICFLPASLEAQLAKIEGSDQ
jgi:hypothetical protein